MQEQEVKALSAVRLEHAKECLLDARTLLQAESYRSAANRAYYAIFHAMRAVLALDGFDSKKHSGIIAEFRRRYIASGIFPVKLSVDIDIASTIRNSSDYNDFFIISKKESTEQVKSAEAFVSVIAEYLASK